MPISNVLSIIVLSIILGCFAAAPSTYFSEGDKQDVIKLIGATQKQDGSWLGLKYTHYAVQSLRKLNSEVPNKDKVCEFAKGALKAVEVESIFYQQSILDSLKCEQPLDDKVKSAVKSALSSSDLHDLYYGVSVALLKKSGFSLSGKEVGEIIQRILGHAEDDGFKRNQDDVSSSPLYSGLAFEALARLLPLATAKDVKESVEEMLNNVGSALVAVAEENDPIVYWIDQETKASNIRVTAALFNGLSQLVSALKVPFNDITESQVIGLAEFFASNKGIGQLEDLYYNILGLSASASNPFFIPLVASLQTKTLRADGIVQIQVSDVMGNAISNAKVTVSRAYLTRNENEVLLQNVEATPTNKVYQLNLGAKKLEPGFYRFKVRVIPEKGTQKYVAIDDAELKLKVMGSVALTNGQIIVADDPQDVTGAPKQTFELGKKVSVKANDQKYIHVSFDLKTQDSDKPISVHQAFLRLVGPNDAFEKVIVVKNTGKGYRTKISIKELAGEVYGKNGTYELHLIIGDSFLTNSLSTHIASLALEFPTTSRKPEPLSPFAVLPEIKHAFRQPEKRPPKTISLAFTGAVLAPALILFIGLIRVGANLRNFPTDGLGFLYAVGFQSCFGATLTLFGVYWLQLTMLNTLLFLGLLSVPALFFANKHLNHLVRKNMPKSHSD